MSRRLTNAFFVLTFSLLWLDHSATALDWNQWRGPSRDGVYEGNAWPDSLPQKLELVWEHEHGPSYSGPVTANGLVFTTETIDKKYEQVTASRLDSGKIEWTAKWEGAMAVPFFAASNGDWIRATPACDGDALVVMGMRDVLVCLDAKTGDERWRIDFPAQLGTPLPSFGGVCSPLIEGDGVYVQTGGPTVKVNLADGEIVWQTLESGGNMMSGGAFSSPIVATIADTPQLLVQTRAELCGVELGTGSVMWKQPVEAFRGMNILTPTVIGDSIFTAAHSGRSHLFEVAKDDAGKWSVDELWNQKTQGYMSSPVVINDQIYLHAKNQRVVAMDVNDGEIRWTSKPFGKYWSMATTGEKVLALDSDGDLRLIKHNESELQVESEAKVADDAWAHIAVVGDYVIVRDLNALKVFRIGG